tara:strand:+ start:3751 stop:4140 length:390 start_codon:yes stop_codon:yes gene_type:complete
MKKKILIVVSKYYNDISGKLLINAKNSLLKKYNIKILNVPGAFEIPVIISKYINKFDGVVALGCIIKGKTPHFNFISQAINNAIINLSIIHKKPIGNGVLTCLNKKQAILRVKKGKEAANAVIAVLSSK